MDQTEYEAIAQAIGQNIRIYRENAGLSQKELGALIYLDQRSISAFENGVRVPSMVVGLRLAKSLGVKPSALWR